MFGQALAASTPSSIERVVLVLRDGPHKFGEIVKRSGLSRRTVHAILKQLMESETVLQRKRRGPYELSSDLLTSQDLKAILGAEETRNLLLRLDAEGKRISKIHRKELKARALKLFLVWNLLFMSGYMAQLFLGPKSQQYSPADETLVKRVVRTHVEPWVGLLSEICREDRSILRDSIPKVSKHLVDLATRNFAEYHKLLFPWTD